MSSLTRSRPLTIVDNITAQQVQNLTAIAFTLEPTLQKKGCTTRYYDLPGKELTQFIVAGINISAIFGEYADSVLNHGNQHLYSHFTRMLQASNQYKNKKHLSLGPAHYGLIVVKTRLVSPTLSDALQNFVPVIQHTTSQDVHDWSDGLRLGMSTTQKPSKRATLELHIQNYTTAPTIYKLEQRLANEVKNPASSTFQSAQEISQGFPTVRRYIAEIDESQGIIKSLEATYDRIREDSPHMKVGILSDFAACALFLYLSYKPSEYVLS